MKERIQKLLEDSLKAKKKAVEDNAEAIARAIEVIAGALKTGHKLLLCGNGGSAADSQHLAAEFIGRFQKERRSLPAIALTTDTSILTAVGNDYGFDQIFVRQVEGLAQKGDILIGLSTSGNSENVKVAVEKARTLGLATIVLLGKDGGKMKESADISILVSASHTARIQESHICIGHMICELVEDQF